MSLPILCAQLPQMHLFLLSSLHRLCAALALSASLPGVALLALPPAGGWGWPLSLWS